MNLKDLLENVIDEAMADEKELIDTDKLPSALVIAKRIETLTQALIRCQQWHHGDNWRDGDTEQRAAWEDHLQTINNALNK